jgi:hypothetical protein
MVHFSLHFHLVERKSATSKIINICPELAAARLFSIKGECLTLIFEITLLIPIQMDIVSVDVCFNQWTTFPCAMCY